MKLDPLFAVKDNKLFKLADNSQVDPSSLKKIELPWTQLEMEDECYNEELLASLRDSLKKMDDAGLFAILVPVVDKPLETPEQFEAFTNAYNHAARRVKDCISVAGYELPAQLTSKGFEADSPASSFMETLAIKHAQYVYFAKVEKAPSDLIVLY